MEVIYKTIYYSIHTPSFSQSLSYLQTTPTPFSFQTTIFSHLDINLRILLISFFFFGVHLVIFVAVETVVGPKEQDDLKGCKRGCCTAWYGGGNSTKAVAVLSKKTFSLLNRSNGWLNCYIFISLYYMYYTVLESSCM